jgi:hypothetical protein
MEDLKEITWRELRQFANSIPEEHLDKKVPVMVSDEDYAKSMNEPFYSQHDIYRNKNDEDDGGSIEDLQMAHGKDFKESDYELTTPKGTLFLWIDSI